MRSNFRDVPIFYAFNPYFIHWKFLKIIYSPITNDKWTLLFFPKDHIEPRHWTSSQDSNLGWKWPELNCSSAEPSAWRKPKTGSSDGTSWKITTVKAWFKESSVSWRWNTYFSGIFFQAPSADEYRRWVCSEVVGKSAFILLSEGGWTHTLNLFSTLRGFLMVDFYVNFIKIIEIIVVLYYFEIISCIILKKVINFIKNNWDSSIVIISTLVQFF